MKAFTKYLAEEQDMLIFGTEMAKVINYQAIVIYLYGQLGSGKTTFTRGFLRGLGFLQKVKSPTYTLVETYEFDKIKVFHLDLYRVNCVDELKYIGLDDCFLPAVICLIEWPEKGGALLPPADLACYFSFERSGRAVDLKAYSSLGNNILKQVKS